MSAKRYGIKLPISQLLPGGGKTGKTHAKFTKAEDEQLKSLVSLYGDNNWSLIAEHMPGRNLRQCKERWNYYLSPTLNTGEWTPEEDARLIEKQREYGSKWVRIAKFFSNRTDTMLKNRFHVLRRRSIKEREMQLKGNKFVKIPWVIVQHPHMCQPQKVLGPSPVQPMDTEPNVERKIVDAISDDEIFRLQNDFFDGFDFDLGTEFDMY